MVERKCSVCGSLFEAKSKRAMYCSKKCRNRHDSDVIMSKYVVKRHNCKCVVCGSDYVAKRTGTKYCSEKCSWTYFNSLREPKGQISGVCEYCGKEFVCSKFNSVKQKYCSTECKDKWKYRAKHPGARTIDDIKSESASRKMERNLKRDALIDQKKIEYYSKAKKEKFSYVAELKVCEHCGDLYMTKGFQNDTQKYCSRKCSKAENKQPSKRYRERCHEGKFIDRGITVKRLFKRDNGKCYICGCDCDFSDGIYVKGSDGRKAFVSGPTYPSVDHVFPLGKGGTHSWDNVRLACFKCNTEKNDKVV